MSSHQPLFIDMVAASVTRDALDKYNQENGTKRKFPTKAEISRGYAISVAQAHRRGLVVPGTRILTAAGEDAEIAASERFRPEMRLWLEAALERNRTKTRTALARRRNPGEAYKVQSADAKQALRKAGAEVGSALWTGSKWAGERIWAGTKVGAALAGKGLRKGAKFGAKQSARALDWGSVKLDAYAARPNPARAMVTARCERCGTAFGHKSKTCKFCGTGQKPVYRCTQCGVPTHTAAIHCQHCGGGLAQR